VLLADEPVASLDPAAASATMPLLAELAHADRLGVLCVPHQPDLARRHADRIVALDAGRVVLDALAGDVPGETLARLTESAPAS
jgi:phosphonate transport system ATP-binding protein